MFENAEIISVYTRQNAIDDGMIVDLWTGDMGKLAREAGFKIPVAISRSAFEQYIALTPAAREALNDVTGRAWDVLYMTANAIRRNPGPLVYVTFYCSVDEVEPQECFVKAVFGEDPEVGPYFTILELEED